MPRLQRNRKNLPFRQKATVAPALTLASIVRTGASELTFNFTTPLQTEAGTLDVAFFGETGGAFTVTASTLATNNSTSVPLNIGPALAADQEYGFILQLQTGGVPAVFPIQSEPVAITDP